MLLKTINDPIAIEWLKKLDAINPPRKISPAIVGLFLLMSVIIIALIVIAVANRVPESPVSEAAIVIPTEFSLPTETNTYTSTPTLTLTDTLTPTNTPTTTQTFTLVPTDTPIPTDTLTPTVKPSAIPVASNTPNPFLTLTQIARDISGFQTGTRQAELLLTPTATQTPLPIARLGPIYDSVFDDEYNVELQLNDVIFASADGMFRPTVGNIYVQVYFTVHNLGPSSLRGISSFSFQILDANGAVRNSTFAFSSVCNLSLVDLVAGGRITGCVAFEVPTTGRLEFIYAPYQYGGLEPGRYISFPIR